MQLKQRKSLSWLYSVGAVFKYKAETPMSWLGIETEWAFCFRSDHFKLDLKHTARLEWEICDYMYEMYDQIEDFGCTFHKLVC